MKKSHAQFYRQCFVVCGLFLIAHCCEFVANALGQDLGVYTVEGLIRHQAVPLGTNHALVFDFRAAVSNCTWAITTKEAKAGGSIYKQVYDGKYVSASARFDPEELKIVMEKALARGVLPAAGSQNRKSYNDSEMIVEARATPITGTHPMASQIWLAFASQCYLRDREEGSIDLSWFVDPLLSKAQFKAYAKWSLDRGFPHLPKSITYYFDRDRFQRAISGDDYEFTARPVKNAPEWVTYSADEFTSFYQLRLPRTFIFSGFESLSGASRLVYTYRGILTNAFLGVETDALDKAFGKETVVLDSRFVDPKLVTSETKTPDYLVTNGVLPLPESTSVQKELLWASPVEFEESHTTHNKRWLYWPAMVITCAVFLLYRIVEKRKNPKRF